jgi:hypothetical protein
MVPNGMFESVIGDRHEINISENKEIYPILKFLGGRFYDFGFK